MPKPGILKRVRVRAAAKLEEASKKRVAEFKADADRKFALARREKIFLEMLRRREKFLKGYGTGPVPDSLWRDNAIELRQKVKQSKKAQKKFVRVKRRHGAGLIGKGIRLVKGK